LHTGYFQADENNYAAILEELDPMSVRTIIDYVYTSRITLTMDNALQLMDAANVLCMTGTFCVSEHFLQVAIIVIVSIEEIYFRNSFFE